MFTFTSDMNQLCPVMNIIMTRCLDVVAQHVSSKVLSGARIHTEALVVSSDHYLFVET